MSEEQTGVASKASLLQQIKAFGSPQPDIELCCRILTAFLFRFSQGDEFTTEEASNLFFSSTKLFQSRDPFLRRLLYTLIRQLKPNPDDCIIVVSCLSKDATNTAAGGNSGSGNSMNGFGGGGGLGPGGYNNNNQANLPLNETCRANATRLLFYLVDDTMVQNIDRSLQQTLIDTSHTASLTASLIAAQHISNYTQDNYIKKFKLEISKSLDHPNNIVAYHALSLTYKILQNDPIAINRFVSQQVKNIKSNKTTLTSKHPLPTILNLRVIAKLMNNMVNQHASTTTNNNNNAAAAVATTGDINYNIEWLETLRDALQDNNNTAIQIESCKIIFKFLLHTTNPQYLSLLQYTISILIKLLIKPNTMVIKFAALRLINTIAQYRTILLQPYCELLDGLLNPNFGASPGGNVILQNKELTMLAINIALKAGNDKSIDYFLNSLEAVVNGVADDSKLNVIFNLRNYLFTKNSKKYLTICSFLNLILKDENRYVVKNAVMTCYESIMQRIPQSIPIILDTLAEYIEDSEYSRITIRSINLIGQFAYLHPTHPEKYIRYIFNRGLLETANIRATAVSAAVKIGLSLFAYHNKDNNKNNNNNAVLAQKAAVLQSIRKSLLPLLLSMCCDQDDEVRDRSRMYLDLLLSLNINKHTAKIILTPQQQQKINTDNNTNNESLPQSTLDMFTYLNTPEFCHILQFPPTCISQTIINTPVDTKITNPAHDVPELDTLEASLIHYLEDNFDVDTTQRSQPKLDKDFFYSTHQQQQSQQQSKTMEIPQFDASQVDHSLEGFNANTLLKRHMLQQLQQQTPGGSINTNNNNNLDSKGNNNNLKNSNDNNNMPSTPTSSLAYADSLMSTLSDRLPTNTATFLKQQQCDDPWQVYVDISSSSTSSNNTNNNNNEPTALNATTEFTSTTNQYVFKNGIVLFETQVKNNFQNAVISRMLLTCPELIRLHQQGHIIISQLADHNKIVSGVPPAQQPVLDLQCGDVITFYTTFKIKHVNGLINLSSLKYNLKLQYMLTFDGEIEKGEYDLTKLSIQPTLFTRPISHKKNTTLLSSLPSAQQFQIENIDFRNVWESLPNNVNGQSTEFTCPFTIQLDSSRVNEYQLLFKQHTTMMYNFIMTKLNMGLFGPLPSPTQNVPQCLINLLGIYLYEPQPQFICMRLGSILQAQNNTILTKVVIKTHHPVLTKLLAQIINDIKL